MILCGHHHEHRHDNPDHLVVQAQLPEEVEADSVNGGLHAALAQE